jgi:hypothetical protein
LRRILVVNDQFTAAAWEGEEVWAVAQGELAPLDIRDAQFRAWRWHLGIDRSAEANISNLDFLASNVIVCG